MHGITKVALMAATALAVMAFTAVSASAVTPRTDTNAAHWTGVDVANPGTYHAHSTLSVLNGTARCDVDLTVDVAADGSTQITGAAITPGAAGLPHALCGNAGPLGIRAQHLPWLDQICEYTASTPHQYWDGIDVDFTALGGTIAGEIYGQLHDDGTGAFDRIDVNDVVGTSGATIVADSSTDPYWFYDDAGGEQGDPAVLDATSNEDSCPPADPVFGPPAHAWSQLTP